MHTRKRWTVRRVQSTLNLIIFLLPTLLFVFVFIAFPILFSGYLSFTEYNYAMDVAPTFIGLRGYVDVLLHDGFLHTALKNQFFFAVPYFILTFLVSLGLAILVSELRHGMQLYQIVFYLPMIIPLSLVGITFAWILAPDLGVFNVILQRVGLGKWARDWYGDPDTALYALVAARSWKMIGFTFIILLSGIQSIPTSLREAARVDGAGFWGEIRHVVLPLLRPYLLISGIWIIINSIKVFDLPKVITQGGPGVSTLTLYLYSWKAAFERFDMGLASRVAYITAFIILFLSWLLNLLLKPEEAERF
ncbi:MAG: sugar ABC transporter permease [Chloroflexi bacterium]|nr:sugar ABC transporter permease [Chloroflexota bacterium]